MIDAPRQSLTKAAFYFNKHDEIDAEDNEPPLSSVFTNFIEVSSNLKRLELYCRQGSESLQKEAEIIETFVKANNWDIETWFEIKTGKQR